ncbi:CCE_0567 family metalloprotein [Aquabacterium sp.]|uniref:CCE_0567 family metalloprotein n=1 Tax=Aquabacterium sp. TaxID=1872578 RepID=UPI002488821A|nr:CCE_0567 family metalloprotein [Aquabacterium sp.]MDI1260816.1 CCE_0567 family metalloprotein [Aquabacterium sp.]
MDADELKLRIRKLNAQATQAKMDLHDLSEDLPTHWENILSVAQRCHDAHAALTEARKAAAASTP